MAAATAQKTFTSQDNLNIRHALLKQAIDRTQSVATYTGTPGTNYTFQITPQNVGLVKRLLVKFTAVITGEAGKTYNLTPFGLANFFSNVTLTDLDNYQRINTRGVHLTTVGSAKSRFCMGSAILGASTDNPYGFGANWTNINSAPASIAAATPVTISGFLEIPISYSDYDLRGAIMANVTNKTWNLQLTINPNLFATSTADPTFAMYQSADATVPTLGNVTLNIYQNYLDNLLTNPKTGAYVLPWGDIGIAYLWNWAQQGPLVESQDNLYPYTNYRNIMSDFMIYDNNGTLTANGTDINYLSLNTANLSSIFKVDPTVPTFWNRNRIKQDMPSGAYYFDYRKAPINTVQQGNQAMVTNPITATGGSFMYHGIEALGKISQVLNAGSLSST